MAQRKSDRGESMSKMNAVACIIPSRLLREGLASLINQQRRYTVCGDTADGVEGTALVREHKPSHVIVHAHLHDSDSLRVAESMLALAHKPRVLFLCWIVSDKWIGAAVKMQPSGVVHGDDGFAHVQKALDALAQKRSYLSPMIDERFVRISEHEEPNGVHRMRRDLLTPRELDMLRVLALGHSLRTACNLLNVSYKTGDKHKSNVMKKLGIHDRVKLARYAIREGLVDL